MENIMQTYFRLWIKISQTQGERQPIIWPIFFRKLYKMKNTEPGQVQKSRQWHKKSKPSTPLVQKLLLKH